MIYKIKQKHTKHTTMYTMIKKWNQKNVILKHALVWILCDSKG
jgi:hypothetical protein